METASQQKPRIDTTVLRTVHPPRQHGTMGRLFGQGLGMTVLYIVLGVLVVLPVAMVLFSSFTDAPIGASGKAPSFTLDNILYLFSAANAEATVNSVVIGLGGTAFAMVWGVGLAWLAARTNVPGRWIAQLSGIVPLFISSLVGALAWSAIAAPGTGYLNLLLEAVGIPGFVDVYSIPGMMFVFGLYYAPYAFLMVYGPLTLMNPELEEAAEVSGASKATVAFRVTLPLVTPALIGAVLLIFVLIIENFTVATLLGTPGGVNSLPLFIYRLMSEVPSKSNQAAAVGLLLMAVVALVLYLQARVVRNRSFTTVSGKGIRPKIVDLGGWRWVGFGFVLLYILLAVVIPLFAIVQMSLRGHSYIPNLAALFDPSALTASNFQRVFGYPYFWDSLVNTAVVAIGTVIAGCILYFALSYLVHRARIRGRGFLTAIANLPLGVPAIVLGLGFLWSWIWLPIPVYGTIWILILANVVRFMPQGFQGMGSSMQQVHRELEESARVSGAGVIRTIREVTLPLIRTGVFGTALLVLVLTIRELTASLFLFTSDTRVVSIVMFNFWESGNVASAAVVALVEAIVLLPVVVLGRRFLDSAARY